MNKNEVLIQLPSEPSYWGSTANETNDLPNILDRMESMIRAEFGARFDLTFERTQTPLGQGVHSDDEDSAQEIWNWISDNWTAAL